jgi:hypothetical protein
MVKTQRGGAGVATSRPLLNEDLTLVSPEEHERRVAVVGDALNHLDDYRSYLKALEAGDDRSRGLRPQLTDRAFGAEAAFRVLLAEGLNTVNDLRDTGNLHAVLAHASESLAADGEKGLDATIERAKERLAKAFPNAPTKYLDEAVSIFKRRKMTIDHDDAANVMRIRGPSPTGGEVDTRVRLEPQAGDLGRVGVSDFFGGSGRVGIHPNIPTYVPPDCHIRPGLVAGVVKAESVDAYSAIVGGLAAGRESMYRHARKVAAYGHRGGTDKAHDPVTIIVGIIIAVGVGLVIYGIASGDYGVAGFGGVLILGGVLVLVGGFELIIGLLA